MDELGDIFAEEGERRVGDDNVRLLQKFEALGGTEIAIPFEFVDADFFRRR